MKKQQIFTRSKRKYKSARDAWADISKKTKLKPSQVKRAHTNDNFVFKLK